MPVTKCELMRTGDDYNWNINYDNSARVSWGIETNDKTMGGWAVRTQAKGVGPNPLPADGQTLDSVFGDSSTNLYLTDLQLRRHNETPTLWMASGTFKRWELTFGTVGGTQNNTNPLARPATYSIEFQGVSEEITQGWNVEDDLSHLDPPRNVNTFGTIVNAAGHPPIDALYDDKMQARLVIQKNFATLLEITAIAQTYDYTVNNTTFFGAAADYAAFDSVDCSELMYENGVEFYQARIYVTIARQPFYREVLNVGTSSLDDDGTIWGEVVNLTGTGTRTWAPANTLKYRTRQPVSYAPLAAL